MPVSRAPKKAPTKKSAAKKSTKKPVKKTVAKKNSGPRLFPTKAELEALKAAREAAESSKKSKKSGPRLFPTKAELEAMKAASSGKPTATTQTPGKVSGKKSVEKIDGEDVELEEVELEDLEKLVSETTEEGVEGQPEVRVVNLSEEAKQEEGEFTLKDSEEDDAPAQTVLTAGATADPVKDY
ncbi:MAG: RNA polymerase sigma factor, partial [Actinobacteria bacterium]|nr:RNA polymerase sigma factor [Actinomycetota bacterium]